MDVIQNKIEAKKAQEKLRAINEAIDLMKSDINTCKTLHDHIKKFGMSEELSDLVDPELQISEEGLLDKIKTLGQNLSGAIRKKWEAVKEKLVKKQKNKENSMNKMIRTIEELEDALTKNNFAFDENKLGMSISAKDLIARFEAAINLEKLLRNKSLIKKNADKIMWWDLSSVITKMREFSVFIIAGKNYSGISSFAYDKSKSHDTNRFYNKSTYTKTAKELGWDMSSLKKAIALIKTGYDVLYTKAEVANLAMEIRDNNNKICEEVLREYGEESDELWNMMDDCQIANDSVDIVEHLLINFDLTFEGKTAELVHTFMPHNK